MSPTWIGGAPQPRSPRASTNGFPSGPQLSPEERKQQEEDRQKKEQAIADANTLNAAEAANKEDRRNRILFGDKAADLLSLSIPNFGAKPPVRPDDVMSGSSGNGFPSSGGSRKGGSSGGGGGGGASYAPTNFANGDRYNANGYRADGRKKIEGGVSKPSGGLDANYAMQERNPDGSRKYDAFSNGSVADDKSAGHTADEAANAMHDKGYGYGPQGQGTRRIPGYASGASGLDLQPGNTIITGERAPEAITKRHDGTLDIKPLSSVHGQPLDESVFIGAGASPEWAREAMTWDPEDQMLGLEALLTKDPRQRNFERARDNGELTPTNVAQAQQFAAKQGFAFDPKSGYSALPSTGPVDEAAPFLAAEDANGPPAGVSSRDWRRFQRTPAFAQMAFQDAAFNRRLDKHRSFEVQDRDQTKRDKAAEDAANEAGIDSILHGLTTNKAVLPSYFTDLIPHAKGVKAKAALHELVLNYLGHQATQDALDKRTAAEDERRSPVDILNMPAPDGKGYVPLIKDKGGNLRAAGGFMPNHTPPAVDYVPFGDGTKAYETFGGELTGRTATRIAAPSDGKGARFTWKQDEVPAKPEKPTQLRSVPQRDGSVKWFDPFTGKEVTPKEQSKPQGAKPVSGFLSATQAKG